MCSEVRQISNSTGSDEFTRFGLLGIVVYLAAHLIWGQLLNVPYSYVFFRLLYLLAFVGLLFANRISVSMSEVFGSLKIKKKDVAIALLLLVAIMLCRFAVKVFLTLPQNDTFDLSLTPFYWECVVPPLSEEPVFRGLFLSILLRQVRAPFAIIISTMIFVSIHSLWWTGMISVSLLGILLGTAFVKTRSLTLCVLLHMVWNFIIFVHIPSP